MRRTGIVGAKELLLLARRGSEIDAREQANHCSNAVPSVELVVQKCVFVDKFGGKSVKNKKKKNRDERPPIFFR